MRAVQSAGGWMNWYKHFVYTLNTKHTQILYQAIYSWIYTSRIVYILTKRHVCYNNTYLQDPQMERALVSISSRMDNDIVNKVLEINE